MGVGRGQESALLFSMSSNPLLSVSSNFSRISVFFGSFAKFAKSVGSGFCNHCTGTDCKSIEWWENCIVYSLFYIFIIIVIVSSSSSSSRSSSIYVVVLLNCLYLNTWVVAFALFSSSYCLRGQGKGERAAV